VIRAVSEVIGVPLAYDNAVGLRDRMWDLAPSLVRYDVVEIPSAQSVQAGLNWLAAGGDKKTAALVKGGRTGPFKKPIENFYRTDPISRASVTMAQATAMAQGRWFEHEEELPQASTQL
jgi:NADH dehydrogenase (ubiquinone) Fe-S protein 1